MRDRADPVRWAAAMRLFEAALERDAAERPAFLAAECGDDAELREHVDALLAADADASGFLEALPDAAVRFGALARDALALGERLSDALGPAYQVERELGGGGMSRVFVAEETRLGRKVVVKVLPPALGRALDIERFRREVRLAATLRHPHIVPLLAAGESADGLFYYTMPYIEGESLRERLARDGALPPADVAWMVREVADALTYAHRRGVVHRDVKPGNVLVDGDHVLVSDFGIAKALSAASDEPAAHDDRAPTTDTGTHTHLTAHGLALGTPAYMSPEQARGDAVDGRSDVYSLGCMAFEMLTGERPSVATTEARPAWPAALHAVFARAFAEDAADRFPTADALAQALADALGTGAAPVAARPRRARGALVASAVAFVVLAAGAAGLALRSARAPRAAASARPTLAVLPFANLGRREDQYVADGIAEEVRTRLARISGLGVIAWSSSSRYTGAARPPSEVGRELGASYVLEGTVRWLGRSGDQRDRVRIAPRLVRVVDGAPVWAESTDVVLVDLSATQAAVAEQVARALDVALLASERRDLAASPTRNPEAYDAYLRGNAFGAGGLTLVPQARAEAVRWYERAVALDPTFALAWARLARAHWFMYDARDDGTPARRDSARVAAERAFALDSTLPEAALALGQIEERQWGAVERFIVALRTNPNNPELLHALGVQQLALGRTSDALASFTRAAALDPRSPDWLAEIANIHDIRHAYDDAVRVRERQIALDPTNAAAYVAQALSLINARGDTAAARRTLARGIGVAGRARLVQLLSGGSGVRVTPVLWSALDAETRRAIDTLSVAGARRPPWRVFRLKAQHFEREGRAAAARAYHDSTVAAVLSALRDRPADPELHETLGLAYAGLGRADDALREGRRAVALDTADVEERPWTRFTLAMIAARVGAPDVSLEALERGLPVSIPSVSAYWLRLDPRWAPMRDLPRFRRLLDAAPDRRETATSSR